MRNHAFHIPKSDAAGRGDDAVFPFQRLDVYLLAKALAGLVHRMDIRDAELRSQARRCAFRRPVDPTAPGSDLRRARGRIPTRPPEEPCAGRTPP